jgi:hypothetical protein
MEGEKQTGEDLQSGNSYDHINTDNISANEGSYVDKRSTGEKIAVGAIIVTAFFAVILGYYQMSRSIKSPFADLVKARQTEEECIGGDCQLQAQILFVLEQQQTDTDSDGLSDYDELNVYNTSPFLEDSDSDGFTDKQEVDQGYDPNCVGESCFRNEEPSETDNFNLVDAQALMSGQSDPSVVRSLLLQNGFPQETLDSISDDDLMTLYRQSLSGQAPNFDTSIAPGEPNSGTSVDVGSVESLQNLTGAEVRQLLVEQGAPAEVLSQISDSDLKAMFLSQLNAKTN